MWSLSLSINHLSSDLPNYNNLFGEDAGLNQQLDLPSTELSLSLEWSIFNPTSEYSKVKVRDLYL